VMRPDATPAGAVVANRSGVTAGETALFISHSLRPAALPAARRPADGFPVPAAPVRRQFKVTP
jgi:hypothetical protein